MKTRNCDVAIIGAGSAGITARRGAIKEGADVVMIESGPYGTMCARVGCMPSKLLIAAADVAHEVEGADRFGVRVSGDYRIDGPAVLERVRRERDRFVGSVVEMTEAIPEAQRLLGHARFVSPTSLEVGDHTRVEARAVVIATGSSPWIPPSLEHVRDSVMVNDDVFELVDLPESLAVVGTGLVGLELGQAMHRLGVRTSFFSHSDRLGPLTDPEVRASVASVLGRELDLHPASDIEVTEAAAGGYDFRWGKQRGEEGHAHFHSVVVAAGRRPNLAGLGLERAGVELSSRGVPRFDERTMQIGDLPIFLAGDVTGERPVLHEAADEGYIAGANAARFPEVRAKVRRTPLTIVFTDPQMAIVGTPFDELDRASVEIGAVSYGDQGRARVMGKNAGVVRIYARSDRCTLVGAEMFGPRVEHTAHLLAAAIQTRLSVEEALELPFYHPVIEEGIRTALRDLSAKLRLRGDPRPQDLGCGPGT